MKDAECYTEAVWTIMDPSLLGNLGFEVRDADLLLAPREKSCSERLHQGARWWSG